MDIFSFKHSMQLVLQNMWVGLILLLVSCSSDYVNVIPSGSVALMSFDLVQMAEKSGGGSDKTAALKSILHVDDMDDCGIDFSNKAYAFESADGSLGMVLSVSDASDMEDWFMELSKRGVCSKITERKGFKFTVLHDNFVAGFSKNALLVMGPAVGAAQAELQRKMIKYMDADDEMDTQTARIYDRLDSMAAPINLVAQAQALPEKFVAPFTLGAPKGTSPADIYIAARMNVDTHGNLNITGENFSFDANIDKALKAAAASYQPIQGQFLNTIPSNAVFAMACGVNGEQYIKQLHGNDAFRSILLGLNTAIDIDLMIKGIDGDMLITVPSMQNDKMDFQMVAPAAHADWLGDVDYWKKSCPAGSKIVDWTRPDTYHFISSDWNVYFGINENHHLFFGSSEALAAGAGKPVTSCISPEVQQMMKGKRLCALVNVEALASGNPEVKTLTDLLTPFCGHLKTIIYSLK